MKKIFLLLMSFGFLFGANELLEVYEPNEKNFRDGFEAGINALKFQAKNDGFTQRQVKLNKPYLLTFKIDNVPHHEALFFQVIAAREGFDTHFTKEFIALGEFEREVDAIDARDLLIRKYNFNAKNLKILKNEETIVTYPFLFDAFYKQILKDAKSAGIIVEVQTIEIKPKVQPKAVKKPVVKKRQLVLLKNSKAMGYTLIGDKKYSKNFMDLRLINRGGSETFEYEETITTTEGEKFVKTKQGIYFSISDVSIDRQR